MYSPAILSRPREKIKLMRNRWKEFVTSCSHSSNNFYAKVQGVPRNLTVTRRLRKVVFDLYNSLQHFFVNLTLKQYGSRVKNHKITLVLM